MTTLPIGLGRSKADIISRAYSKCGMGDDMERTPEEMGQGLMELNIMMMEAPWSGLGYSQPVSGDGDTSDLSGIEDRFTPAVVMELAMRLAPGLGKSMSTEAVKSHARSVSLLRAEIATAPQTKLRGGVYLGSGRRTLAGRGTLYSVGE